MAVVWGVHAVVTPDVHSMTEAVSRAGRVALTEGFAEPRRGDRRHRRRAVRPIRHDQRAAGRDGEVIPSAVELTVVVIARLARMSQAVPRAGVGTSI